MSEPINLEVLKVVPLKKPKLKKAITLYNLFQEWLISRSWLTPSSRERYRDCFSIFELWIAGKKLNLHNWHGYKLYLIESGYSPWSIQKMVRVPIQVFNWALERGYMKCDPWWKTKTVLFPPVIHTKLELFTYEEYERMKAACIGRKAHMKYQLVVGSYNTGMSPVDVCLLKWSSVDLEAQVLRYVRGKMATRGGRECMIPLASLHDLYQLLMEQSKLRTEQKLGWTTEDYVFPALARARLRATWYENRKGGASAVAMLMKTILKDAGITGKKSLKSFRNTFCSDMMNSGVDSVTVCQMSGHSNPKQLLEYVTPNSKSLHAAMERRLLHAKEITPPKSLLPVPQP